MRIVITSNYRFDNETGTAHVAKTISKHLAKKHEVMYICLGKNFRKYLNKDGFKVVEIPSIEINKISIPLISPDVIFKIFSLLNKFKPNIIHSQNSLFISSIVQMWANLNMVPFIVTFHHIPSQAVDHIFPKLSKNILSNLVQDLYKDISLKSFLKKSDLVIALNKFIFNSIRKIDSRVPIQIINNGIDFKNTVVKSSNSINLNRINFVFTGSYNERKNQEYLVKVFKYLPQNYFLNIYGNKTTGLKYVEKLNKIINGRKIKNVKINDYQNDPSKIYKDKQYFVSASVKEAQSLAVIEALANSIPVIGLKNETISELINEDNGLVLAKSTSPKQFALSTFNLVKQNNYKTLSRNAKASVKNFEINKVISKMEEAYKSVTYSQSDNRRRNISQYYQEIFEAITIQK